MLLAAVQYRPPHGQPTVAREDLVALAGQAVDAGAELVVLPEMATTGYVFPRPEAIRPFAEPADGPTLAALAPVARRGAWIVAGYAEAGADGALYNSALVIAPDGTLAASYRKVLLYTLDELWARPGRERTIVETPLGRVAPAICMDLNDDRLVGWLHREGPDVVAFCTNWVQEGADVHAYWRMRLRGWRGWFVAANRWGWERGVAFSGASAILAPGGRVVARAPKQGDGVILAETEDWPD